MIEVEGAAVPLMVRAELTLDPFEGSRMWVRAIAKDAWVWALTPPVASSSCTVTSTSPSERLAGAVQ